MTDFTYTGSIQTDDITVSGTYSISAIGAAGGSGDPDGAPGGLGAAVTGDIYLAAGTVLEIITGGAGAPATAGGGGGGGGSFVIETNNGSSAVDIVLAAAGGGGGGGGGSVGTGGNALTSTSGGAALGATGGGGLLGGSGGTGGGGGDANGFQGRGGGGGGGVNGNGGSDVIRGKSHNPYDGGGGGGQSAGFGGGAGGGTGGAGGFGGGGGGGGYAGGGGGGGGGGYAGGGGGYGGSGGLGGGGGGSYDEDLIGGAATPAVSTSDGNGDVTISTVPICYLAGTQILTPTGLAPVESLKIGDSVITRFSGIRPIKWIGRQTYAPQFIAPEKWPVCVRAGALGENLPTRDLFISPGHSMLLGDILVLASNLINNTTITQTCPDCDVNYVQLDLGTHDCVMAEGSWSESYADAPGLRAQFHNAAEYDVLYPNDPPPEDLTLCAPRPDSGPRLEAALRLLPQSRTPEPPGPVVSRHREARSAVAIQNRTATLP